MHDQLIKDIYEHISLPEPKVIAEYSSIDQAFSDFPNWSKRVEKVMTCFWSYQFPMAIPSSYWARFELEKDGYRLNIKRTPNEHGCFVHSESVGCSRANGLTQSIYRDICAELKLQPFDNAVDELLSAACEKYETELELLEGLMTNEDPTCQIGVEDFIFLGNFHWLQQEIWFLEKSKSFHCIPINELMLDTLTGIKESNKLFLTFSNVVVIVGLT